MNLSVRYPQWLLLSAILLVGCDRKPARVEVPRLNPKTVAAAAIRQCDTDGDGLIDSVEVASAPGLKAGWERLDTNADGKLSAEEIAARIRAWQDARIGAMTYGCSIQFRGKPLEGATIILEPEPFLGTVIAAAEGETGPWGITYPVPNVPDPMGMTVGFYRLRVSKIEGGRETIPAKYNTETTVGVEVAGDIAGVTTPVHGIVLE